MLACPKKKKKQASFCYSPTGILVQSNHSSLEFLNKCWLDTKSCSLYSFKLRWKGLRKVGIKKGICVIICLLPIAISSTVWPPHV